MLLIVLLEQPITNMKHVYRWSVRRTAYVTPIKTDTSFLKTVTAQTLHHFRANPSLHSTLFTGWIPSFMHSPLNMGVKVPEI